jgi:hypothetical protein
MTDQPRVGSKRGRGAPRGNVNRRVFGHRRVQAELKELRHRSISGRTWLGRTMRDWKLDLMIDLGGEQGLSTQERALVDVTVRTKVLLDQVDMWLLSQPRLISRRKGLNPIVLQRGALLASLRGLLSDLGIKRRARDVESLADYLTRREHERAAPNTAAEPFEANGGAVEGDQP